MTVAVNALMHTEMMAKIKEFLDFLVEIKADRIAVGDAGVIFILQRDKYELPFTYDASTMVASARQVNFGPIKERLKQFLLVNYQKKN